jgi:hypothetical protein
MTDEAMSPLRRRMIEDMTVRKFTAKTQHGCRAGRDSSFPSGCSRACSPALPAEARSCPCRRVPALLRPRPASRVVECGRFSVRNGPLARVHGDGADDRVPVGRVQFVTAILNADELRAPHCFRQRNAVVDRVNRIRCAVNDEKRCPHLMQPAPPFFSYFQRAPQWRAGLSTRYRNAGLSMRGGQLILQDYRLESR